MISKDIKILNDNLPDDPGVYFYYDEKDVLLYIGKATSLKRRVQSYFTKAHDNRIAEMVSQIARIHYIETPTVIEAFVLEANQIKAKKPKYNILQRDNKSFLYLVITNDPYPKPVLMRGHELASVGVDPFRPTLTKREKEKYLAIFGPYISGGSLRKALGLIRRIIPWSDCEPPEVTGKTRGCFNTHIGKCPGVCSGQLSKAAYKKIMRKLILFFEGKKTVLLRRLQKEMENESKKQNFEAAAKVRNQIFALNHIQDIALIRKDEHMLPYEKVNDGLIDLEGRIEAYDISNISGTSATGSMVVFEEGKPAKNKYRKFKIKMVEGPNDVAMLEEVLRRRLRRAELYPQAWPIPEIMVIDGGNPQVNRVQSVLDELGVNIPIIGLAKGLDRKQDRMIYNRSNFEIARVAQRGKELFQRARDEAHRFAVKYHRELRAKNSLNIK